MDRLIKQEVHDQQFSIERIRMTKTYWEKMYDLYSTALIKPNLTDKTKNDSDNKGAKKHQKNIKM